MAQARPSRTSSLKAHASTGIWSCIARGTAPEAALPRTQVEALATFIGTALTDHLLQGQSGLPADQIRKNYLLQKLRLTRQQECLHSLAEAVSQPLIILKGFANAHWLYSDPCLRSSGDLDLLIASQDLSTAIDLLKGQGFRFAPLPTPAWGFLSTASYQPLVSPDGQVNLDLHVEADCWPAYLGLSHEALLIRAIKLPDSPCLRPSTEHAFLLMVSNAAKDKFGPYAVKKVVDALVLLRHHSLDWDEIDQLAARAHLSRPLKVFLSLLEGLGAAPPPELKRFSPQMPWTAGEFDSLLKNWLSLFERSGRDIKQGKLALFRREWLLCTEPDVAVQLGWRRLKGMLRPYSGLPESRARND